MKPRPARTHAVRAPASAVHRSVRAPASALHGCGRAASRAASGALVLAALAALLLAPGLPGCRASRPEPEEPGLALSVEAIPFLIEADTSATAQVWVTVLENSAPVADSTRVDLAASAGVLPAIAYTRDGLATASYRAPGTAGSAFIVAQCRGVRDTTRITLF